LRVEEDWEGGWEGGREGEWVRWREGGREGKIEGSEDVPRSLTRMRPRMSS